MNTRRAALAGAAGALAISVVGLLARSVGLTFDLEMMLGSALLHTTTMSAWLVGFGLHLALGATFGVLYAVFLERTAAHVAIQIGVSIGSIHAVVSGIAVAILPALHPLMPEHMAAPGLFLSDLGVAPSLLFVVLHLAFGGIVGGVYRWRRVERRVALT